LVRFGNSPRTLVESPDLSTGFVHFLSSLDASAKTPIKRGFYSAEIPFGENFHAFRVKIPRGFEGIFLDFLIKIGGPGVLDNLCPTPRDRSEP
jgi:hypothetical protein